MRNTGFLLLLILCATFIFAGCKQADEAVEKSEEKHEQAEEKFEASMPENLAPEVWGLIHTENYKLWKMWPGKDNIFVNPIAYEAIQKKEPEFPVGTIIVRERYAGDNHLQKIYVAYRIGGIEETKGWFAADYSPDGQVIKVKKSVVNIKP